MSEIVAYAQASLNDRMTYAKTLAAAGDLIPKGLWAPTQNPNGGFGPPVPSPGKILLVMETGSMLGLHPMAALQSIDVVEGRATLSAKLMAGMIRAKGHTLNAETTGTIPGGDFSITVTGKRTDGEEWASTWDIPRAIRAGLVTAYAPDQDGIWRVTAVSKSGAPKPWQAYAEAMAWNRAVSEVGRQLFSDVLFGLYSTEEMTDGGAEMPVMEAEVEPSEDWETLIREARSIEALEAIRTRVSGAGEVTDRIRALYAARLGVLESEQEVTDDEHGEVGAEPDAADAAG